MANRGKAKTRQSARKSRPAAPTRAGQSASKGRASKKAPARAVKPRGAATSGRKGAGSTRAKSSKSRPSTRAPKPSAPVRRPTYAEAVRLYEQAVHWVQEHQYAKGARLLHQLIDDFPEEKELHDRAALYLNVCEKQVEAAPSRAPQSPEERLYAATIALNAGEFSEALDLLGRVVKQHPDNDHAHYVRAVALTLSGRAADAASSLERAIELNAENRLLARQDPDLEALRQDERSRPLLEGPGTGRARGVRHK